ncbi:MAG: hypothetical protein LBH59_04605 [Planctomycetaceae bacterium]|jgi:hypothetical protein|nr:hypothetical protein [Planctomycetaceae bacterium]
MKFIPKPVWAVGFALEQTLHVVALTVFSYVDFKVVSAYNRSKYSNIFYVGNVRVLNMTNAVLQKYIL